MGGTGTEARTIRDALRQPSCSSSSAGVARALENVLEAWDARGDEEELVTKRRVHTRQLSSTIQGIRAQNP